MKNLFGLALFILLVGCAHHRDVRPGDNGENKVIFKTEMDGEGYQNAMSQANHYCDQFGKSAYVISEGDKYTGDMKEESYKSAKQATKAGQIAGSALYVLGGRNESNLGGAVTLGSSVARQAMGKGYTYELKFKCK